MSAKTAAKHRHAPESPFRRRPRAGLRGLVLLSGTAVVATGLAVSTGVLATSSGARPTASPFDGAAAAVSASDRSGSGSAALTQDELSQREDRASRSSDDRRPVADRSKARTLSSASGRATTRTEDLSAADPQSLAKALMPQFGMSASQFGCLDNIWSQESGWNVHADNPSSSAYGIPQALPGSKMASAGPNWADNPETQIRWGLGYIRDRYGSACSAWSFKQGAGWY